MTLAEFAADVRAATPSVAAELVVPSRADELARLRDRARPPGWRPPARALRDRRQRARRRAPRARGLPTRCATWPPSARRVGLLLDRATRLIDAPPRGRADGSRAPLDDRLPVARGPADRAGPGGRSAAAAPACRRSSPFATLERGYAIVRDAGRRRSCATRATRSASAIRSSVRLQRGELDARVEGVRDSAPDDRPGDRPRRRQPGPAPPSAGASPRCPSTRRWPSSRPSSSARGGQPAAGGFDRAVRAGRAAPATLRADARPRPSCASSASSRQPAASLPRRIDLRLGETTTR